MGYILNQCFFLYHAGGQTQGLEHARQAPITELLIYINI